MAEERISQSNYKENGFHSIQTTTVLTPSSLDILEYARYYKNQISENKAWMFVSESTTNNHYQSTWRINGVCGKSTAQFTVLVHTPESYTLETTINKPQP